jgi:hypothetical protein
MTTWAAAALLAGALAAPAAAADKEKTEKVVGFVAAVALTEADPAAGKAAEATVTLRVKGKKLDVVVRDALTLKKLRIKKIAVDDEVRVQYRATPEGDKTVNLSVTFRRTAGC